MGNSHKRHDHASPERDAAGNLGAAFLLNFGFTLLEIVGGLWTNSVAILTDALHDAGDCVSLGVSWRLQRLSRKGRNPTFTYGYQRFSTLGALIGGLVLLAGLGYILWQSATRLLRPEEVNAPGMIALAVAGIVMNGAAVIKTRGGRSLNEAVVSWHLLEDTLGWIAVLIGSVIMAIWAVPILDPILSMLIALFVLWNVAGQLRHVLRVFLQSTPESFDLDDFTRRVAALPGVRDVRDTHAWSLDGERHVLSTRVVLRDGAGRDDIVAVPRGVRDVLADRAFEHITVEVALDGEAAAARPEGRR